tara:strand:+ start:559 stop:969 length:411 start_codon:yes stop_codon:yes gene_type:complete
MVRKDFNTCPIDFIIKLKRVFVKIPKNLIKDYKCKSFGNGPKKRKSFKERKAKRILKQVNGAKKMGFVSGKKIMIGIYKYLYIINIISINEKGIIVSICGEKEQYSLKNLKIMHNEGLRLIEIKERKKRIKNVIYQ